MFRILAVLALLLPFIAGGCTFQANNASQAVDFNPFAIGSGQSMLSPASGPVHCAPSAGPVTCTLLDHAREFFYVSSPTFFSR